METYWTYRTFLPSFFWTPLSDSIIRLFPLDANLMKTDFSLTLGDTRSRRLRIDVFHLGCDFKILISDFAARSFGLERPDSGRKKLFFSTTGIRLRVLKRTNKGYFITFDVYILWVTNIFIWSPFDSNRFFIDP